MKDETVAFHEAGHAVAAVVLKRGTVSVSIVGNDFSLGRLTHCTPLRDPDSTLDPSWSTRARKDAVICAAGPAAQAKRTHKSTMKTLGEQRNESTALTDCRQIEEVLNALGEYTLTKEAAPQLGGLLVTVQDFTAGFDRTIAEADALVRAHWPAVEAVAAALLADRVISGKRVREIVAAAIPACRSSGSSRRRQERKSDSICRSGRACSASNRRLSPDPAAALRSALVLER